MGGHLARIEQRDRLYISHRQSFHRPQQAIILPHLVIDEMSAS